MDALLITQNLFWNTHRRKSIDSVICAVFCVFSTEMVLKINDKKFFKKIEKKINNKLLKLSTCLW